MVSYNNICCMKHIPIHDWLSRFRSYYLDLHLRLELKQTKRVQYFVRLFKVTNWTINFVSAESNDCMILYSFQLFCRLHCNLGFECDKKTKTLVVEGESLTLGLCWLIFRSTDYPSFTQGKLYPYHRPRFITFVNPHYYPGLPFSIETRRKKVVLKSCFKPVQ